MKSLGKKEALILFFGDIFLFVFSLWLSLYVRFGSAPSWQGFQTLLVPFSFLFVIWFLIYFIAGLYEKHTLILKSKLPSIIWSANVLCSILAVVFFYTIPFFGITPKTILFIDLLISFVLSVAWRTYGVMLFGAGSREQALLIGSGNEMKELFDEVNGNSRYGINFVLSLDVSDISGIDIQEEVITPIYSNGIKIIAVDFSHRGVGPLLPHLYNLIFSKISFIDSHRIYEDIFDRIPLSLVTYSWFLENISVSPKFTYDFLKRIMDIVISFFLGIISFLVYPFVWLAIKLDDGGKIFIHQERVGQNNHTIRILKCR